MKCQSLKVRLYPTKSQKCQINKTLAACRKLYNYLLSCNINYYEKTGESKLGYALTNMLPSIKAKPEWSWLKEVDAQALQVVTANLTAAYKNFFRRVKHGENPGFPKFKSYKADSDSFASTQTLNVKENKLWLPKTGWVKFRNYADLEQHKIKKITVSRKAGKYFASCLVDIQPEVHIHKYDATVGVDIGVAKPVTISYPGVDRHLGLDVKARLKKAECRRKRYQRSFARKLGTFRSRKRLEKINKETGEITSLATCKNLDKAKKKVQLAFERERNIRKDFQEKLSTKLTDLFPIVVFEDLKISNMTRKVRKNKEGSPRKSVSAKSGLNRELLRLGLATLVSRCQQKALSKGGEVKLVDPKYTSQKCSECQHTDKANRLSQSRFRCVRCGFKLNADFNAARNIAALA